MWISRDKLKKWLSEAMFDAITMKGDLTKEEFSKLEQECSKLREDIEQLKLKKKLEMQEIEHLVKIENERLDLESQKERVKMQEEFAKKELTLRQEFFDKNMTLLKEQAANLEKVYCEIMKRLPNVNLELNPFQKVTDANSKAL